MRSVERRGPSVQNMNVNKSNNFIKLANALYWLTRLHYTSYRQFKDCPWLERLKGAQRRCNNKLNEHYGAKGIECLLTEDEIKYLWFRDIAWRMEIPSIDRKNSNGNYELSNCQFIEMSKNCSKASKTPKKYRLMNKNRTNHGLIKYTQDIRRS